jgi:predicted hotdog family 3-hydroxylacyl-ACP dehydratase
MIAQSYAAIKGYEHLRDGCGVKKGFLVGVRKFEFAGRSFKGDRLMIIVTKTEGLGDFAVIQGEVTHGDHTLAFGTITLWMPESG